MELSAKHHGVHPPKGCHKRHKGRMIDSCRAKINRLFFAGEGGAHHSFGCGLQMAVEVSESWDSESLDKLSPYGLERLSFELTGDELARSRRYGTYKCARCMNAVYHSKAKFQPMDASAAQWPTFRAPVDSENSIRTRRTYSFGLKRTEVLCKKVRAPFPPAKLCCTVYRDRGIWSHGRGGGMERPAQAE